MGLGLSTEVDPNDPDAALDGVVDQEYGFRVHRVELGSPGAAAGLQSILDYIVVANGVRLDADDGTFVQMISESINQEIKCIVFNTHTMRTRQVVLMPRGDWGGAGLLGVTIRFDIVRPLDKHTLHVLDVYPSSPASTAGLDGHNDYIVGVGDLLFDGPDEFGEIVAYNNGRPMRLYVYNARTESMREVTITPDQAWGGDGCLGCGVGSGYLHLLPRRRLKPVAPPPQCAPSRPATATPSSPEPSEDAPHIRQEVAPPELPSRPPLEPPSTPPTISANAAPQTLATPCIEDGQCSTPTAVNAA